MSTMGDTGRQLLGIVLGGACVLGASCATAQITPDRTLPNNSNVTINGSVFNITGGTQAGRNLFHSFQQFSVPTGGTASFNNGLDVQNIFSRVTGGSISTIDGLIKANGTANLFLINPTGIIFGPNASLGLNGSFFASTANSLVFDNGFEFSATNPQAPPLLTVNIPIGLRFRDNPGSITVNGSHELQRLDFPPTPENPNLAVKQGQTLALVGGNISLDGGALQASGGRVELGGLTAAGMVRINSDHSLIFPDGVERADVLLKNASNVDVSGAGSGSIAINARNIDLQNSNLTANISQSSNTPSLRASGITLNAAQTITLRQSSQIETSILDNATLNGSDINITTGTLLIKTDSMNVSEINTFTSAQGNAGNVIINARDTVSFDGARPGLASGIVSVAQPQSTGNAGNISIETGTLSLTNGAQVSSISIGQGAAGSVMINASDHVFLDGISEDMSSGVNNFNFNNSTASIGNNGSISITTGTLSITNGAQLITSTSGRGNAGDVTIDARDRVFFNNGRVFASANDTATGRGGDVSITSGDISLANGSLIILDTAGQGNAGNANLTARSLSFTNSLLILSTNGQGAGGNAHLSARSLSFTNSRLIAGISPDSSFFNGVVRAGNIALLLGDLLLLRRQSLISTSAGNNAFAGNSGNITINSPVIVAFPSNNDIIASAFSGSGGQVTINTSGLFGIAPLSRAELEQRLNTTDPSQLNPNRLPTNDITAISQQSPTINSSFINPSRSLFVLPTWMVQAPKLVSSSCEAFNETARGSSFIITGRGGLPPNPYEPLTSDVVWTDTRLPVTTSQHQHKTHAAKPKPQPRPIMPTLGWVFNDKGQVVLTAYDPTKTGSQRSWREPASCAPR